MASRQMSESKKAEAEEMMTTEVAKSLTVDGVAQNQPGVVGAITNNRGTTLRLYVTTSWTGNFHTAPPGSVDAGGRVQFSHTGSKGALIYAQEQGSAPCCLSFGFVHGQLPSSGIREVRATVRSVLQRLGKCSSHQSKLFRHRKLR